MAIKQTSERKHALKSRMMVGVMMLVMPLIGVAETATSAVPLPPAIASLPSVMAEPWVKIADNPGVVIEVPAFDKQGNLYISSIFEGRVIKVSPDKEISTIFTDPTLQPNGIAIHKDGRLFVAGMSGKFMTMTPDGQNATAIEASYEGNRLMPNDLVFDKEGNFYFTDFVGSIENPVGGVYRFSADLKTVEPVVKNLAAANGIGLAPAQVASMPGNGVLWVAETGKSRLLRIETQADGISLFQFGGLNAPYHFTGFPGPDSMATDSAGNIYQAMIYQGRILILNAQGIPVANVLMPGRDEGKHLGTGNVEFKPGTKEGYITAWGPEGAWIFKFEGLAAGMPVFSHQE